MNNKLRRSLNNLTAAVNDLAETAKKKGSEVIPPQPGACCEDGKCKDTRRVECKGKDATFHPNALCKDDPCGLKPEPKPKPKPKKK